MTYEMGIKHNHFNFDKSCTNRINFQIPIPLFYSDELLHFGTDWKCEIVFNIDSNWFSNSIQITGSNACGIPVNITPNPNIPAGIPYTVVSGNGITPLYNASTITVTVTDLKLYLCRFSCY